MHLLISWFNNSFETRIVNITGVIWSQILLLSAIPSACKIKVINAFLDSVYNYLPWIFAPRRRHYITNFAFASRTESNTTLSLRLKIISTWTSNSAISSIGIRRCRWRWSRIPITLEHTNPQIIALESFCNYNGSCHWKHKCFSPELLCVLRP